jgi:hypothetical protein
MTDTVLTPEEALLWMNDRLGKIVGVTVRADVVDDASRYMFSAIGELHHWREDLSATFGASSQRVVDSLTTPERVERMVGFYLVGHASLDLTRLERMHVFARDLDDWHSLLIELGDGVHMEIVDHTCDE